RPDIGLARERLGWEPHVDLDEGLEMTAGHFHEQAETSPIPFAARRARAV
ncbi:MAG: SDR family NAD-dependent epimerase/dehydratase, partial [Bauldia sp.]